MKFFKFSYLFIAVASLASGVQAQSTPPTAAQCSELIRRAQDEAQRRRMTKEDLGRTNLCLSLMSKSQPPAAPVKIFRN